MKYSVARRLTLATDSPACVNFSWIEIFDEYRTWTWHIVKKGLCSFWIEIKPVSYCIEVLKDHMATSTHARKAARALKLKQENKELVSGVWSELQYYIPLQLVYEKLPHKELSQFRLVCKEWNHGALQKLELPKPYFNITTFSVQYDNATGTLKVQYQNGVLTYDVASEKYNFQQQQFQIPYQRRFSMDVAFAVEGLIFCHDLEDLEKQGVFNIHNQSWHAIPPILKKSIYKQAIGLMVDTFERPYSFKLVVGSFELETLIYDSKSQRWRQTSSRLPKLAKSKLLNSETVSCLCDNGYVYISIGVEILLRYSMEGDTWSIMNFPEVVSRGRSRGSLVDWSNHTHHVHALGEWKGRIFTTREDSEKHIYRVWELVNRAKEWKEYTIIPRKDSYELMGIHVSHYGVSSLEGSRLMPCFCNGYLLFYNWHLSDYKSYRLGMLNLATKEFNMVKSPWKFSWKQMQLKASTST